MAEYIEREAALRANCYFCSEHLKDDSPCVEKCADYMKFMEIPAADVRPVVLCRDCKYWKLSKIEPSFRVCTYVFGATFVRNAEDFCSRGEKRGGS